jgi:hypothetical protein
MKNLFKFLLPVVFTAAVLAQGPARPRGRHGFGPGGGPGFGPGLGLMSPGSKTPVTGAPYSAVQSTESQQPLADGNQIARQEQSKVYRDSQGRVRLEHTRRKPGSNDQPQTMISIFDPVAGYSYLLNPAKQTAVKVPLPPANGHDRGPRPHPEGQDSNVKTENLGTQSVNGVSATGTRFTRTIPAGAIGNAQPIQIIRETWVSPDLKVPVLIKGSDPRFGNTMMQLTNIVQAEPDAALFQVPADYTVEARSFGGGRPGMPHD